MDCLLLWSFARVPYCRRCENHWTPTITTTTTSGNLLTHTHSLNMVVGPNGTGKSTILNAICLGLGGRPSDLGRADDARDFIAHGHPVAEIEIEIRGDNDDENYVFHTVIDRNKGSEKGRGKGACSYSINRQKASREQIKDMVSKEFNISIDNLCTFLPQDKVGSFSGFSPQQLLLETEKTLSTSRHLYHTHLELIQAEEQLGQGDSDLQALQSTYQRLLHEHEQLHRAKERLEERQRALHHADLYRKKLLWMEYDHMLDQAKQLQATRKEIKAKVKQARETLKPIEHKCDTIAAKIKEIVEQSKDHENKEKAIRKQMDTLRTKADKHDDEKENLLVKITELGTRRLNLQRQYDDAVANLKDKEDKIKLLEPNIEENTLQALQELNEELRSQKTQLSHATRKAQDIAKSVDEVEEEAKRSQQRLVRLNDGQSQRRANIFRQFPNLQKIHEFVQNNADKFRRTVMGPIVLEMEPQNEQFASYLEQHIPNSILKSFVVQDKRDQDFLYSEIRTKMKIPINILLVSQVKPRQLQYSPSKLNQLKKDYGLFSLDECLKAPDVIMEALRANARIQDVFIGDHKFEAAIKTSSDKVLSILSEPDPAMNQTSPLSSVVFFQNTKVTTTVSRYGGGRSSRYDTIDNARMLTVGSDPNQIREQEQKLEESHRKLDELRPLQQQAEDEKTKFEKVAQESKQRIKALREKLDKVKRMKDKLKQAKGLVNERKKQLEEDKSVEKGSLVQKLMNRVSAGISAVEEHAQQQMALNEVRLKNAGTASLKTGLIAEESKARYVDFVFLFAGGEHKFSLTFCIRMELESKQEEMSGLENEARQVEVAFGNIKRLVNEKLQHAEQVAPLKDEEGNETKLAEEIAQLEVSTIEECQTALEEAEDVVNSTEANDGVLEQYRRHQEAMMNAKQKLDTAQKGKSEQEKLINGKRRVWEESIEKFVVKVNLKFNEYMKEMNCTGEIKLNKAVETNADGSEKRANFSNWGIEIWVAFRAQSKAQILSQQVHSGGERSVSTIMYLMALQDLMVSPFRCVDEINQGLDERNERLVFRRIVQNSTIAPKENALDHSGQYFLITPKLLPNLTDMEVDGMTVLFVFNGPFNFRSPSEWNVDKIVGQQGSKKRTEAADDEENSPNLQESRPPKKSRASSG